MLRDGYISRVQWTVIGVVDCKGEGLTAADWIRSSTEATVVCDVKISTRSTIVHVNRNVRVTARCPKDLCVVACSSGSAHQIGQSGIAGRLREMSVENDVSGGGISDAGNRASQDTCRI